jgi:hypothetical protein
MPGILSARNRPEITLVAYAAGVHSFSDASEPLGKGYLWLTADKRLQLALNTDSGSVRRVWYDVESVQISKKAGRFTLTDGRHIDSRISDCGCGMGAAGNAPYMTQPHRIKKLRELPSWVTTTK